MNSTNVAPKRAAAREARDSSTAVKQYAVPGERLPVDRSAVCNFHNKKASKIVRRRSRGPNRVNGSHVEAGGGVGGGRGLCGK